MKSDVSDILWLEEKRQLQSAPAGVDRRLMHLDLASPYYATSPANLSIRAGRGDVLRTLYMAKASQLNISPSRAIYPIIWNLFLSLLIAENLEDLVSV